MRMRRVRYWNKYQWLFFALKLFCNPIAWAAGILIKVFVVLYLEQMAMPTGADFREEVWKEWARFGRLWMSAGIFLWVGDD